MNKKVTKVLAKALGIVVSASLVSGVASAKTVTYQGESVEVDTKQGVVNQVIVSLNELSDKSATQIVLGKNIETIFAGADAREDFYTYHYDVPSGFSSIAKGYPKLKSITVEQGNVFLEAKDGVLYSKKDKELLVCPLEKTGALTVSDGVETIGKGSVYGNKKITSVKIPSTVKKIYGAAFGENAACKKYVISSANKNYVVKDGVLFTKDMKKLVSYPAGKKGSTYKIPKGVKTIECTAFAGAKYLKKVTFSSSVKTVSLSAFLKCKKLTKVTCNKKLKTIEAGAFYNCSKLKSIALKKGLKTIQADAFGKTKALKKLTIPKSVTTLDDEGLKNKKVVVYKKGKVYKTWKREKALATLKKVQKLKIIVL